MALSILSPLDFGELIDATKTRILAEFVQRSRQQVSGAAGERAGFLRDHLLEILTELAEYLKTEGSHRDYVRSAWLADKHGLQRTENHHYTVENLREEYEILNEILLDQVPPDRALSVKAVRLLSELLQMSISHSTEAFLKVSDSAGDVQDSSVDLRYWLHEAVNHIPKPLFFLNLESQKIWFSNRAAKQMLGLPYEDEMDTAAPAGKLSLFLPDGTLVPPEQYPSRRALQGQTIRGEEFKMVTLTGTYHIRVFAEQLKASFGQPASAVLLIQDITTLKATEDSLRKTQSELSLAMDIAEIGFWTLDIPSFELKVSPLFLKPSGVDPKTFKVTFESAFNQIHPQDRERVSQAVNDCIYKKIPYDIEYRIHDVNGEVHWIQAKGETFYDGQGQPVRFAGTTIDVTESVRAREEIEQAKRAAETANQTKSQFLANMSHEIRTPLGAIMGFASLLKDPTLGRDQHEGFVSVIERNSNQLLRIIDDILDLSKVEAGMLLIEKIDFSLPELLTDLSSMLGFKAREKGIGFSSRAITKLPKIINSDPTRLRQILMNVVGNAIKFTDSGQVDLRCCYLNGFLDFEVEDTGRGISEEQARHLFQPFAQADSTITRKYGGTGLGLVLTRSLAEAMGGTFELKRSELGKGATFAIRIPVAIETHTEFVSTLGFETVPPKTVIPVGELAEMRILLVEDSPDNQALISIFLGRAGARTDIASDGAQGYKMALMNTYDIVLMDVQMPVMDGITAVKTLRQDGYAGPVIALTAHAMKEERTRCLEAGFTDFLSKPIVRADLIEMLARFRKADRHESR